MGQKKEQRDTNSKQRKVREKLCINKYIYIHYSKEIQCKCKNVSLKCMLN